MLEHVNITVSNPEVTASNLCQLFGWTIRWSGRSSDGGLTIHVGSETSYVAIYSDGHTSSPGGRRDRITGGLNHVGVVVDDLAAVEVAVVSAGFSPHTHSDYEPGRRFYFDDHDGIEFEVVSYQ